MKDESFILHETENLWLGADLLIRLTGATHSIIVGSTTSIEDGKRTMDRLEKYPGFVREFYQHR